MHDNITKRPGHAGSAMEVPANPPSTQPKPAQPVGVCPGCDKPASHCSVHSNTARL